jgi:predicted phage terminase large subunit-like protein
MTSTAATPRHIHIKHDALPAQRKFWQCAYRFRAFVGGVGSGKTRAGCLELLRMPANSVGMVVAPTYPQLRDSTLAVFLKYYRGFIDKFNSSSMTMTLKNGTTVLWRSADKPDTLRGPNLSWFWIDEGCMCKSLTWDVLIGRLRLSPGRGWITTTPRGYDWVYKLFEKEKRGGYQLINATTYENSFNPPEFVEELKAKYSTEFAKQELLGKFIRMSGSRIKEEWVHVGKLPQGIEFNMGVDPAIGQKAHNDWTAIVVGGKDSSTGIFWVADVHRMRGTMRQIMARMKYMATKWHCQSIAVESVQAQQWLCQELWRDTTLPVRDIHPSKDKLTRFMPLEARYEQGLIYHSESLVPEFTEEVTSFTGNDEEDSHDDFVDAFGYCFLLSDKQSMSVD